MAKSKNKIELICEGASKEFDVDHAERILNFQSENKNLNSKKLWKLPEDSKHILKDGKIIKRTGTSDDSGTEKS